MTSSVKIQIYNRSGRKLDEIVYNFSSLSWLANGVGQLPISLPYSNPKATKDNIKLGNWLLVQFDNARLPAWGGVMDTPFRQDATSVNVTGYTAEQILAWRETTKTLKVSGPPGAIFAAIIQNLNATSDTGISLGTIDKAGDSTTREYHFSDALEAVNELSSTFNQDWAILPVLDGQGKLRFTANWWVRRGVDRTGVVTLREGANANFTNEEQGQVASTVRSVGQGSGWGDDRKIATAYNNDSRTWYGFREKTFIGAAVSNTKADLQASADGLAYQFKKPISRVSAVVVDHAPGRFVHYHIGDVVTVQAFLKTQEWSIDGPYRVRGRELINDNTCKLTLEEYR